MFIDTHCHLNLMVKENFDIPLSDNEINQSATLVKTIKEAGIDSMVTVGTNLIESTNCIKIAEKNESVYAVVGIHPQDCKDSWKTELEQITPLVAHSKVVAVGECGLDYHYSPFDKNCQKDLFKAQIELAITSNVALVIHTWDAFDETLNILEPYIPDIQRVVIHCFSESATAAQQVISLGCFIGIPASITYPKNERLRNVVQTVGLNSLVLETDSPFLPPQHMRGKRNTPTSVITVAEKISQLLNVSLDTVAEKTTNNAKKLYLI